MNKRRILIVIILCVITVVAVWPKRKIDGVNQWISESNQVLVIAHAGGRLNNPGNTMSAFRYSYDLGVDVLEMDVQMTSDGVLVLRHGENDTGNIRSMSNCDTVIWDETYQYLYDNCNFGFNYQNIDGNFPYRDMTQSEWVASEVNILKLEDLFIEYGSTTKYVIEIKADADAPRFETADKLVELIKEYELEEYVLTATSFEDISLYIRETYPGIMISASHAKAQESILKSLSLTNVFLNPDGYYALQIPTSFTLTSFFDLKLDNKFLVNQLHRHNIAVHYWTINDEDVMKHLIDIGADGIITDDPELLIDIQQQD